MIAIFTSRTDYLQPLIDRESIRTLGAIDEIHINHPNMDESSLYQIIEKRPKLILIDSDLSKKEFYELWRRLYRFMNKLSLQPPIGIFWETTYSLPENMRNIRILTKITDLAEFT